MSTITAREYLARAGTRFNNADARLIGPELEKLRRRERISPYDVVSAARDRGNPLHTYFEWDNLVAAQEHRLAQAREMIGAIEIRVEGKARPEPLAPASVQVCVTAPVPEEAPRRRGRPPGQRSVPVLTERDEEADDLAEALCKLRQWRTRYAGLAAAFPEVAAVLAAIDALETAHVP